MTVRMIIIDDEPWAREVVKALINWDSLGISLAGEADDGDAGLELLRAVKPEIVIADMRMPGMDGTELLQAIHTDFPETRIVVMSGHSDFAYLRQALRSRAHDYLIKPVDPAELNRTLERCISELSADQRRKPQSLRTPVVFRDASVLEEYVTFRRHTFGYLLELNEAGVSRSLSRLQEFLSANDGDAIDEETRSRIVHDFLIMLEEFVVRSGAAPDPEVFRRRDIEQLGAADMFDALGMAFEDAINAIREHRRFKDHLDTKAVRAHIDQYYQEAISLETVAQQFLVSKEHLSRSFRRAEEETVNEYITRKRMETARHLIADEGLEIKEVALLTGYSELAYFYRVFKRHFGVPPGQVRQSATPAQAPGASAINNLQ